MSCIPLQVLGPGDEVVVGGKPLPFRAHSLLLDIALAPSDREEAPPEGRWFPAIVDTGNTHNLSIRADHFTQAAAGPLYAFPFVDWIRVIYANGRLEWRPLHEGNLWVRSRVMTAPPVPVKIELSLGFTYYEEGGPPYPIVGTRALSTAGLCLTADYERRSARLACEPVRFGTFLVCTRGVDPRALEQALQLQRQRRRLDQRCSLVELTDRIEPADPALEMRVEPWDVGRTLREIACRLGASEDWGVSPNGGTEAPRHCVGEILVELGAIDHAAMLEALQAFQAVLAPLGLGEPAAAPLPART